MSERYCQNGGCLAESVTKRGPRDWPLCSTCADAYDAGHTNADSSNEHNPEKCGCKYIGNDMWSCGHIDNVDVENG